MEGAYATFAGKDDLIRWTVSGAAVLAAHILLVVAVLAQPDMSDVDAGSPIVTVDLAPVAAAPSTIPSDQPPAPQVQTEAEERTHQDMQQEKQPDQPVDQIPEQKSEAELPQRVPDPPKEQQHAKRQQEEHEASHAAAPQSADVMAALPAAPPPGLVPGPSTQAMARWGMALKGRIEAVKRYPTHALGASGVVKFDCELDRDGHVLSSKITQSSGSEALDAAALETLKRADPLPLPPKGIADKDLLVELSLNFQMQKAHAR
jgi:periplasmic protein TonB